MSRNGRIILAALLIGTSFDAAGAHGAASLLCLSHTRGRVEIRRPIDGSLGICSYPDGDIGIRWPGPDGAEFLGGGGIYLRFREPGSARPIVVGPERMEPLFVAPEGLGEGCEGGKRYPHPERDDDGDGRIDEDPCDGIDNDGDGRIDEDFAARGDEMRVTRAIDRESGLVVQQSSYTWSYGHVRDFIGFTTLVQCARADRRSVEQLEAALYMEFMIGGADDPERGEDDRRFFVETESALGRVRAYVAADGQYHVALLPLEAAGPWGQRRDILGLCLDTADSLWSGIPSIELIGAGGTGLDDGQKLFAPGAESGLLVSGERGERAVALRLGLPVARLGPGEALRIDWALVFAKSAHALEKNIKRAVETYAGIVDGGGSAQRWVVPARKAVRVELDARPAYAWSQGRRRAAAAIVLPPDIEDEEVEWLRAPNGGRIEYQQMGGKVIVMADDQLSLDGGITIEGQLTDGTIISAKIDAATLSGAADDDEEDDSLPDESMQLYPNPFLSTLNINLRIYDPSALAASPGGESTVSIYDVRGRLVKTVLEQELLHPGEYLRAWNGLDEHGKEAAPGVYYVKLQIGSRSVTKRVILLR